MWLSAVDEIINTLAHNVRELNHDDLLYCWCDHLNTNVIIKHRNRIFMYLNMNIQTRGKLNYFIFDFRVSK